MRLTESELLDRLAADIDRAGSAQLAGLDPKQLERRVGRHTNVDTSSSTPTGRPCAMLVVAARAVAEDGTVAPAGPREHWPTVAAASDCKTVVAVVMPADDEGDDGAGTGRALLVQLPPDSSVALDVSRVYTADALLDRDEQGFIVRELTRNLSAAQLQRVVAPTLRISPEVSAMAVPEPTGLV